jgi:hypothetical protein
MTMHGRAGRQFPRLAPLRPVGLAALTLLLLWSAGVWADNSITAPDKTGTTGLYPSLELDASGNPVIAYFRSDTGNLKVMHCNDPDCAGDDESIEPVDTAGSVGINPSLALDHLGYPVVSYYDSTNGDLKVLHCNDPDCSGGNESITSPATVGDVGFYSALFVDTIHHPNIAFYDTTNDLIKFMRCNDDNCAGGNETITTVGGEAQFVAMVPDGSGFPVITWRNTNPIFDTLWIIHCNDFDCTSYTDETPDPGFGTGLFPSLVLDDFGNPVVSYKALSFADLTILHCNDPDCAGAAESITTPIPTGSTGAFSSLRLDSAGNPAVSYYDESDDTLGILHCDDPDCDGSGDSIHMPDDDVDDIGWYTSLELDSAGYPVVAYYNASKGNLKLLHCDNPDCDPLGLPIFAVGVAEGGLSSVRLYESN